MVGSGPRTRNQSNAAQTADEDSNLHSVKIVTEPVNADYDTQLKQPSPEIPITNIFSPIQAMLEPNQPPPRNRHPPNSVVETHIVRQLEATTAQTQ
jgi:hypothetical protein